MAEPDRPVVCVVDDDQDIRESLRFLLEEAGYTVEEADNGLELLTLLRTQPRPRVVLLDRMMGQLDGIQTLRQFSGEPTAVRRNTVIIFMSARSDHPDPASADLIAKWIFATVVKPFHLDDLLATVTRASAQLGAQLA
ncbi:MAG TPA: response regulator [Ktedonobacterales bacterium]|nr:response regulator [Ktedonobacterales bacterium]